MSLRSMTDLALERDSGTPPRRQLRGRQAAGQGAPAAAAQPSRSDVLVSAIPTEVLGPYTAIVGVIVATIGPSEPDRSVLRWALYCGGLIAIVLWLGSVYLRERDAKRARRFPVAEVLAALIAFAAWGLIMPGSPLSLSLGSDDLTIWTAIITAVGVFLVSVLATPLRNPATVRRGSGDSDKQDASAEPRTRVAR
jgi:hypothetical protein